MEIETRKVIDDDEDATWGDVGKECTQHTGAEWANIAVHFTIIFGFLYFFLFSLGLLGTSAKIIGGCTAGDLLGDIDNPIAGLCIGILATVLMQVSFLVVSSAYSDLTQKLTLNGVTCAPPQLPLYHKCRSLPPPPPRLLLAWSPMSLTSSLPSL